MTKTTAKKSTDKTKTTPPPPPSLLAPTIMMLVSGMAGVEVISAIAKKYKVSKEEAETVLKEARQKITTASTVSAREELGLSLECLKNLYKEAVKTKDLKTALSILKEKNRILNLYDSDDLELISESAKSRTEELVRQHLEPLLIGLGVIKKENEPLEELARLSASTILQLTNLE